MPQVYLSNEQKAQLVGWLNREKDHLLSIVSMAERIIIPGATGTLELAKNDLEFASRLRLSLRNRESSIISLSDDDAETLVQVARANKLEERDAFWSGVVLALEATSHVKPPLIDERVIQDKEELLTPEVLE